jgi:hypothetical protein
MHCCRRRHKRKNRKEREGGVYRLSEEVSSRWEASGWDLFLPFGIGGVSDIVADCVGSGRERGRSEGGLGWIGGREAGCEESLSREELEKATAKGGRDWDWV